MTLFYSFFLFTLFIIITNSLQFSDVTSTVGLSYISQSLSIGAILDQNGDKRSDLLLVNKTLRGDELVLLLWDGGTFKPHPHSFTTNRSTVVSTLSFDFDGDGYLDILITSKFNQKLFQCAIFWGNQNGFTNNNVTISDSLQTVPLMLDANGDHLPDVLSATPNGQLTIWLSDGKNRSFLSSPFSSHFTFTDVSSLHYIDINSDCLADVLILQHREGYSPVINIWLRNPVSMNLTWSHSLSLPLPSSHSLYGQPSFTDLNGDGQIDMLILSCPTTSCVYPILHVLYQLHDTRSDIINCHPSVWTGWKLQWATVINHNISWSMEPSYVMNYPPTIGDIDLNRYPDVILITHNSSRGVGSTSDSQIVRMYLNEKGSDFINDTEMRAFNYHYEQSVSSMEGIANVVIIDLWEDGIPDLLLVTVDSQFIALKQLLSEDHMFVKTLILSGYCFSDCSSGHVPFGSILPGALVAYETSDRNGHKVTATGSNYQSSSCLLNSPPLPYIILGLGTTANFIETLMIGAPNNVPDSSWYRQWSLLVPNSQLTLVPLPIDKPKKWKLLLYLTPSGLVYSVSGVLLAICIGLLIIVLLLHAREKYQDSKDRKQSKQKFYFNAM